MTDKQIMINGVDVSGCINLNKRDKVSCFDILYDKCKEVPNCYYKQLARKTQECEQIKEKYEALKLENQEGYEIVDELKQKCEELKKQLMQKSEVDMFFNTPIEGWSNDPCGICPHKAENEELKEENQQLRNNLSDSLMFRFTSQDKQINRYRKALKEIEEYINNQGINNKWNMRIQRFRLGILDIINKAKGGN